MRTTRRRRILILIPLLIVLIPLGQWLAWLLTPVKPLNIAIIDKTVLNKQVREHISLNWLLTNRRITKKDSSFYTSTHDYLGLFPERIDEYAKEKNQYVIKGLEQYTYGQIDSIAAKLDMAYFADTYGLYFNEWQNIFILEHSPLIYGGMSEEDIHLLTALKKQKKLIITEFNDIATPTPRNIRTEFAALFGIEWTGWAGRYFDNLDTNINKELPFWLKKGYVAQHSHRWPFKKPGIVFVHEDGRIEVLENQTHLNHEYPVIQSGDSTTDRFGVINTINYPYWFDIIRPSADNHILSFYEINTNQYGDSILRKNGIPNRFPAAIERKTDCRFYYFCGDFTDNPVSQWLSHLKYIDKIKYYITISRGGTDESPFFWKYYVPMVSTILDENF